METAETESTKQKTKAKPRTDSLRVRRETKKKILTELANLNRKELGKAITPDQYVTMAISKITPDDLEKLKEQSLSNKDRLESQYRKHCTEHGKISMDDFLGRLLASQKP